MDFFMVLFKENPYVIGIIIIFFIINFKNEIIDAFNYKIFGKTKKEEVNEKEVNEEEAFARIENDNIDSLKSLQSMSTFFYVLKFKEELIIANFELFKNDLMFIINKAKEEQKKLVLDLSRLTRINENTRDAFRDILKKEIEKDELDLLIVFPIKNVTNLCEELEHAIKSKESSAVQLKRDSRSRME